MVVKEVLVVEEVKSGKGRREKKKGASIYGTPTACQGLN